MAFTAHGGTLAGDGRPGSEVAGGAAAPNTSIAAVARFPTHMDLFAVGTDHKIYSIWWDANGGWAGSWFNVSGGVAAPLYVTALWLHKAVGTGDLLVPLAPSPVDAQAGQPVPASRLMEELRYKAGQANRSAP